MNEKDFVTFKTAKKLKEAGYNEPCSYYYTTEDAPVGSAWNKPTILPFEGTSAVSYPMAELHRVHKWLREEKKIDIDISSDLIKDASCKIIGRQYFFTVWDNYKAKQLAGGLFSTKTTYEEALSDGIDAALELIISKQNDLCQ